MRLGLTSGDRGGMLGTREKPRGSLWKTPPASVSLRLLSRVLLSFLPVPVLETSSPRETERV